RGRAQGPLPLDHQPRATLEPPHDGLVPGTAALFHPLRGARASLSQPWTGAALTQLIGHFRARRARAIRTATDALESRRRWIAPSGPAPERGPGKPASNSTLPLHSHPTTCLAIVTAPSPLRAHPATTFSFRVRMRMMPPLHTRPRRS